MSQPELDWTIDEAPAEHTAGQAPPAPPPRRSAPRPQRKVTWTRRRTGWLLTGLALLAAAALGVFLVYQNGWNRVQAQIRAAVVYEDEQSLAGNADAVRAVQLDDGDSWNQVWQDRRGVEAQYRLAAPAPADNLRPAPGTT